MQHFKTKFKRDSAEALKQVVTNAIEIIMCATDDDKMFVSLLAEINEMLYKKLGNIQHEYKLKFTPAQAFAMRMLYTDVVNDGSTPTQIGNQLRMIADQVHQQYS